MGDVKRYDPDVSRRGDAYMDEKTDGDYVPYDDYATLEAELATVKKVAYGNMELLEENAKLRAELERRVPDGFALVPVEPTPEMVSAAEEAYMPFGDMDIALRMAVLSAPSVPATVPDGFRSIVVTEVCPESRSVEEYVIDADSVRASWRLIRGYREQSEALRAENERLLEALEELMYARTDKAEALATAAIAAARKEGGNDPR